MAHPDLEARVFRAKSAQVRDRTRLAALLVAALIAILLAFPAPRAGAFVYWDNSDDDTIGRANLDGSGTPNNSFITGLTDPFGIEVDSAHFYWASCTAGGSIGRANIDGTGANLDFISGADFPCGVEVDASHLYWTNCDTDPDTIGRADINGTNANHSFITGGAQPCGDPAVNASFIYWANSGSSNSIGRADIGGTNVDNSFITGASTPCGVAVTASFIYWANFFGGTIGRANLDGSGSPNQSFITGADDPCGVDVDGSHLYWSNGGTTNTIGRANLDGSGVNQSFITGSSDPGGVAVDSLTLPPSPPAGPSASNAFSFAGKPRLNKRKGTATLTIDIPGAGTLVLAGNGIAGQSATAAKVTSAASQVTLIVRSKGKKKRALNRKGKVKVVANVTYTPTGGSPNTQSQRIKLIKRS